MFKRSAIALVVLILVGGLCAGLIYFNFFRTKMIGQFFANMKAPAVSISTTVVKPSTWKPEIEAIGTLRAAQGVNVSAEAAGTVRSIDFQANDHIEAAQLLVQIDDDVEKAQLGSAQATLERDQSALERAQRLRKTGVTAESSLDDAQMQFAAASSEVERIQAVMEQKAIRAPFSGTIGIPRVDEGEYVQPGTVIATLQQLDTMKADFTVPEQLMHQLHIGQAASFGLTEEAFAYQGSIIGIDPKIDPQTRLVSVRAEVRNPDGQLSPGQFIRVRVQLPPVEDVIALPQTAVVTSLYGDYVYVVEPADAATGGAAAGGDAASGGTPSGRTDSGGASDNLIAKQVFVTTGHRQGNLIEIAKGLEPGQTVVTSGQNKLANNTPVTINNSVDPAELALDGTEAKP